MLIVQPYFNPPNDNNYFSVPVLLTKEVSYAGYVDGAGNIRQYTTAINSCLFFNTLVEAKIFINLCVASTKNKINDIFTKKYINITNKHYYVNCIILYNFIEETIKRKVQYDLF